MTLCHTYKNKNENMTMGPTNSLEIQHYYFQQSIYDAI